MLPESVKYSLVPVLEGDLKETHQQHKHPLDLSNRYVYIQRRTSLHAITPRWDVDSHD